MTRKLTLATMAFVSMAQVQSPAVAQEVQPMFDPIYACELHWEFIGFESLEACIYNAGGYPVDPDDGDDAFGGSHGAGPNYGDIVRYCTGRIDCSRSH